MILREKKVRTLIGQFSLKIKNIKNKAIKLEEITVYEKQTKKNDDIIEIEFDVSNKKIVNENTIQTEFIIQESMERLQSVEMARNNAECNVFKSTGAVFTRLILRY
jgi:hypothetical protein